MGYNEPDALLRRHLFGEQIKPRFPYRTGMVLRSIHERTVPERPAKTWREVLN
jgi:carbamoyl-phosphate synthase large subunit